MVETETTIGNKRLYATLTEKERDAIVSGLQMVKGVSFVEQAYGMTREKIETLIMYLELLEIDSTIDDAMRVVSDRAAGGRI